VELTEEEKLWSDRSKEKNLYSTYADFLKDLPVSSFEKISRNNIDYDSDDASQHSKQLVAEYRDMNNGDAEVYLMEEHEVEVAFVDEEEELRATEKSRNKEKWEFAKEYKKSLHREDNVLLGRKVIPRTNKARRSTYFAPKQIDHFATIEKYYAKKEESIIR
jgi:hypothetical protein